jgi:hypothetical protein
VDYCLLYKLERKDIERSAFRDGQLSGIIGGGGVR